MQHENLIENRNKFLIKIFQILGLSTSNIKIEHKDNVPNKGYSAFSINFLILRYKIFNFLKIQKFIHRPIIMMGPKSVPSGFEELSVLPKKYWSKSFLRDNEEVRSVRYPNNLNFAEKLSIMFSFRNILKNNLEKKIYLDWPILDRVNQDKIKSYYRKLNYNLQKELNIKLYRKYFY